VSVTRQSIGDTSVATGGTALTSSIMPTLADSPGVAVLRGGPMDGRQHPIEGPTDEFSVVMTDGQQHRYVRTEERRRLPDGRTALVFDWSGRYYGPK
jgi:hypothetical protein